jgi:hypothetical protein
VKNAKSLLLLLLVCVVQSSAQMGIPEFKELTPVQKIKLWENAAVSLGIAKATSTQKVGDTYFVRFEKPVAFEALDGVIPADYFERTPEVAAVDVQIGTVMTGPQTKAPLYVRILTTSTVPDQKSWNLRRPKGLEDTILELEKMLAKSGLETANCKESFRAQKRRGKQDVHQGMHEKGWHEVLLQRGLHVTLGVRL